METILKSILTKLIEDADNPQLEIFKDGEKYLHLPTIGDPYYSADARLTQEEFEFLKKEYPELPVRYR